MDRVVRTRRKGMSLIEIMIGLTLSVLLLAAVTSSIVAMSQGIRGNDGMVRSQQVSRVLINYITSRVRQAQTITITGTQDADGTISGSHLEVTGRDGDGVVRTTTFDFASSQLVITRSGDNQSPCPALKNVVSLTFKGTPVLAADGATLVLRTVRIDLTVDVPDVSGKMTRLSYSGSAYARPIAVASQS